MSQSFIRFYNYDTADVFSRLGCFWKEEETILFYNKLGHLLCFTFFMYVFFTYSHLFGLIRN
jgi:hypothetical protein